MSKRTYCANDKCDFEVLEKSETTGYILNNIDLSEVLTPGIYLLGDNVTDTNATGDETLPLDKSVVLQVSVCSDNENIIQESLYGSLVYQRQITIGTPNVIGIWNIYNLFKFTSGPEDPTGGNDGDIYFQYGE